MQIIDLPAEILHLVLCKLDAGSYYCALRSCTTLFSVASRSKGLLSRQLLQLPGSENWLDTEPSADRLLRKFNKRVIRHLCGLHLRLITTKYLPLYFSNIKIRECVLTSKTLVLVCHSDPIVRLYGLGRGLPKLKGHINAADPFNGSQHDCRRMEILKMAISPDEGAMCCLLRATPVEAATGTEPAEKEQQGDDYELVTMKIRYRAAKGYMCPEVVKASRATVSSPRWRSYDSRTRPRGTSPSSIAVADDGATALTWSYAECAELSRGFIAAMYPRYFDDDGSHVKDAPGPPEARYAHVRYFTHIGLERDQPHQFRVNGRILASPQPSRAEIVCSGAKMLMYPSGSLVAGYADTVTSEYDDQSSFVIEGPLSAPLMELTKPFHGYHATYAMEIARNEWEPTCVQTFLALAMPHDGLSAYIVEAKTQEPQQMCNHVVDVDRAMSVALTWTAIAQLDGMPYSGRNSIGNIMAISPSRKRIAVANWTDICFWTLENAMLHGSEFELAAKYPTSYLDERDFLHIPPVHLKSSCVIHHLSFFTEGILFAVTEKGLSKWELDSPKIIEPRESKVTEISAF
ncbi:MAG: hypothetical protein M1825_002150 [Sarcosagium campestre]|nr:MAG: hypothetical protein M1825_002150 [Sarcosagium campestre]